MAEKLVPYADRLALILTRPGLIDEVFAQVANGGDLITLAETWDIRYSDLADWIRRDLERSKVYTKACELGDEWIRKRLLKEIQALSLSDIREAFDENGNLKPIKDLPADVARAIAAVEVDELYEGYGKDRERVGDTKKVKFWDKRASIELLMKQKGMLVERHLVKGAKTLEELVAESREGEDDAKEKTA